MGDNGDNEEVYLPRMKLIRLSARDRENLIACVRAELELLAISDRDYEGPLVPDEIIKLRDLLLSATAIYIFP